MVTMAEVVEVTMREKERGERRKVREARE